MNLHRPTPDWLRHQIEAEQAMDRLYEAAGRRRDRAAARRSLADRARDLIDRTLDRQRGEEPPF